MFVSNRSRFGGVIPLVARPKVGPPWSNEERAQLYGVAKVLGNAGLAIDTENGLTDEGDPWFAFVRPDTEEVVAHFARIDGLIVATGLSVAGPVKGLRLRDVVNQLLTQSRGQSFALREETRSVILHPIVGLATFIAIGMLAIDEAKASAGASGASGGGAMGAALDFVINHLRSHGPSDEDGAASSEVTAASGDPRAAVAAGNEAQSSSKQFQILATVVALAISLTGAQPYAGDPSADLVSVDERVSGASASARSDKIIVADDATAENNERAHGGDHDPVVDPLSAESDELRLAATPAPDAAQTQETPSIAGPQLIMALPGESDAEHDGSTVAVAVRAETGLLWIDMALPVHGGRPALALPALETAVPATVFLGAEKALVDGKVLLAEFFEMSMAPVRVGGDSYVLVDFTVTSFAPTETSALLNGGTSASLLPLAEDAGAPTRSPPDGSKTATSSPVLSAEAGPSPSSAPPAPARSEVPLMLDTSHVIDVPAGRTSTVALSAGADTVLFNGGNLRVEHFQFGVDKLLVASALFDWSKAAVTFKGADAVIQFDAQSIVTLVGVLPHEMVA